MLETLAEETLQNELSPRLLQPALVLSWKILDAARIGQWDEVGRLDVERTELLTSLLQSNEGHHSRGTAADLQVIYSLHQEVETLADIGRAEVAKAATDLMTRQKALNEYNSGL